MDELKKDEFITELKTFVDVCQDNLNNVLQTLGWTPEKILQHEGRELCPHNSNHVMPAQSLEKHASICPLLQRGYNRQQATQIKESSKYFYEGLESRVPAVDIDQETMNKILWDHHVKNQSIFYGKSDQCLTRDDLEVQLTPAERAAIYDYTVTKAKEMNDLSPLKNDEFLTMNLEEFVKKKISGEDGHSGSKPKNYLEYIKAERDYKRRRQSYRAKNVYTTKKSYTEVIRDVIDNQTDLFASFIKMGEEEDKQSRKESDLNRDISSDRSEEQHERSRERSTERSRERQEYRRERIKERSVERYREQNRGNTRREHSRDRSRDRSKHKARDRSTDRTTERGRDRKRGRSSERLQETFSDGSGDRRANIQDDTYDSYSRQRSWSPEGSDSETDRKHKKSHKKRKHKHKHKHKSHSK